MVLLSPDALYIFFTVDGLAYFANTVPTTGGLVAKAEVFRFL